MSSRAKYAVDPLTHRWRERGFSLIELLLVIAMGSVVLAMTAPLGLRFYQVQVLDETAANLESALRGAHMDGAAGRYDLPRGVQFFSDRYVIFSGMNYASRTPEWDADIPLPLGAALTLPANEIVFMEVTGAPSATGTILVSLYGDSRSIAILESGVFQLDPSP